MRCNAMRYQERVCTVCSVCAVHLMHRQLEIPGRRRNPISKQSQYVPWAVGRPPPCHSMRCSRFTELNSHLDNSPNVVATKYSSSKSIMCTNQIISKCSNYNKWPAERFAFHNSLMNGYDRNRRKRKNAQIERRSIDALMVPVVVVVAAAVETEIQ